MSKAVSTELTFKDLTAPVFNKAFQNHTLLTFKLVKTGKLSHQNAFLNHFALIINR